MQKVVTNLITNQLWDMVDINSGHESDNDLIYTEMLEDICDRSQNYLNVNRREARYKIRDRISQSQS